MSTEAREIADGCRSADSCPSLISGERHFLGSFTVNCGTVVIGVAASYDGPILRAAFMLSFLSGLLATVRVNSAYRRVYTDVGLEPRPPQAVRMWLLFYLHRDMATPRSRWRMPRRGDGVT